MLFSIYFERCQLHVLLKFRILVNGPAMTAAAICKSLGPTPSSPVALFVASPVSCFWTNSLVISGIVKKSLGLRLVSIRYFSLLSFVWCSVLLVMYLSAMDEKKSVYIGYLFGISSILSYKCFIKSHFDFYGTSVA